MRSRFPSSTIVLLAVNGAVLALAVAQHWSVPMLLWMYWGQSVIIGVFQARKIFDLRQFETTGVTIGGAPAQPTEATKRFIGVFFLFHYGIFHLVYALFLASSARQVVWLSLVYGLSLFFLNHWFSYRANRAQDRLRRPNIGTLFFFPYIRILPMHAIILFGSAFVQGTFSLILFLLLKTVADLLMHVIEHRLRVSRSQTLV